MQQKTCERASRERRQCKLCDKLGEHFLTAVADTHKGCEVMTSDTPNTFIQAPMSEQDEKAAMKIAGKPVDISVNMHQMSAKNVQHVKKACEKGRKVLHAEILQALCGMSAAALLWCDEFKKDSEEEGFTFDPCDPFILCHIDSQE